MDALTYFTLATDPLEATNIGLLDETMVFHVACINAAVQGKVPVLVDDSTAIGRWPGPCAWERCTVKPVLTLEN